MKVNFKNSCIKVPMNHQQCRAGINDTTNACAKMAYYYTRDHIGSIREMVNGGGTIEARYSYDPYGRATKVSGSLDSTCQYTGDYYHPATSFFNLTLHRAYDPNTGRWLSRDPSGENRGLNL